MADTPTERGAKGYLPPPDPNEAGKIDVPAEHLAREHMTDRSYWTQQLEEAPPLPDTILERWEQVGGKYLEPRLQAALRWLFSGDTYREVYARTCVKHATLRAAVERYGLAEWVDSTRRIARNWRTNTILAQELIQETLEQRDAGERGDWSGLRNLAVVAGIGTDNTAKLEKQEQDGSTFVSAFQKACEAVERAGLEIDIKVRPTPDPRATLIDVTPHKE